MYKLFFILTAALFLDACKTPDLGLSAENKIVQIAVKEDARAVVAVDTLTNGIRIAVNPAVDINALTLSFELSPKAKIDPLSGLTHNLSTAKNFVVTAENGQKRTYSVSAFNATDEKRIFRASIPSLFQDGTGVISTTNKTITFTLPFGTNVNNVSIDAILSEGATASPAFGVARNYSQPVQHDIIAPNGSRDTYTVNMQFAPQETGVRAVWVTNVASSVLFSEANLTAMVDRLAELNFNTICVVAYNKSQTIFPSETLANVLGTTAAQTVFTGAGWGDVLQVLIDKAHAKNMKVIAWFEYGFASHVQGQTSPLYDKKPEWISRQQDGKPTEKNSFFWLNGFHPEVQKFMTDMIVECVRKYPKLDGIQGDDRLPALPAHAGYDDFTRNLYKVETGRDLPTNPTETQFLNWKSNKMSDYAVSLYNAVKAERASCLVTWAPSARGWAKDNYLQDWPEWVRRGVADWVSPQLYRQESQGLAAYSALIDGDLANVFNTTELRKKYVPGMLVRNGSMIISDGHLAKLIQYNRSKGLQSEATWFYEGVPAKHNAFKVLYPGVALFPQY